MRIKLTSVFVDDQGKALKFYTEILGFVKKTDIPVGEFRWLTVVSPENLKAQNYFLSQMTIRLPEHSRRHFIVKGYH